MAAPDGGWGWAIVLGSFLAHVAFAGCTRSFGVVYLEILHHYHSNPSSTAWIGAIHLVLWGACGPIATALSKIFGERRVAMLGGLIMSSGLICAGFAPNLGVVYLGYCIAGFGLSLTYTPGYALIGQYFHKRKALAMSIATAGGGVGAFALSPLIQISIFHYGYSGAMLILAGILLNTIVGGALLRPLHSTQSLDVVVDPELSGHPLNSDDCLKLSTHKTQDTNLTNKSQKEHEATNEEPLVSEIKPDGGIKFPEKEVEAEQKKRCSFTLLRYPGFWGMCLISAFTTISTGVAWGFTAALAVDRRVDLTSAAFLLSVLAMADIAGRLISGFLFDIRLVWPVRPYLYASSVLLLGLITVLIPLCWTYASLILGIVFQGLFLGTCMAHRATIMADLVGQKRTPMAFGFVMLCNSLGHLIGRGLGGVLQDVTGSYDVTFYFAGASSAVSALMFFLILGCSYSPHNRENPQNTRPCCSACR